MSNPLPLSLSAYFVPPTDCIGEFGLLTGYSADTHFFNDALDKFTQTIKSQRAYEGSGYTQAITRYLRLTALGWFI